MNTDAIAIITTLAFILAVTIMTLVVLAFENRKLAETNKTLQKRITRYKRREVRRAGTKN